MQEPRGRVEMDPESDFINFLEVYYKGVRFNG